MKWEILRKANYIQRNLDDKHTVRDNIGIYNHDIWT